MDDLLEQVTKLIADVEATLDGTKAAGIEADAEEWHDGLAECLDRHEAELSELLMQVARELRTGASDVS